MSPLSSHSSELSLDSAQSYGSYMSSIDKQMCSSNDLIAQVEQMSAEPLTMVTVVKQEPSINNQMNYTQNGAISAMVHKPLTPPLTPTTGSNVQHTTSTCVLSGDGSNNSVVKLLIPAPTEVSCLCLVPLPCLVLVINVLG